MVSHNSEPSQPSTWAYMRAARRWLMWASDKQPFYVDGTPRRGTLDTDDDLARLATYEDACRAVQNAGGRFAGIGFALGADGTGWHWQGIDLDDVEKNQLSDLANYAPGYVELSPSGKGCHVIGYGANFPTLGPNRTGIEAYAGGRYFTVTMQPVRPDHANAPLCDLSKWVMEILAPRHQKHDPSSHPSHSPVPVSIDPKTVTELRSALNAISPDDYDTWVRIGCALSELGNTGQELWLSWSQRSEKWKPQDATKWSTFHAHRTGYQAVFAEAQRQGWVNPNSNAAQIETPAEGNFTFSYAQPGDTILKIEYLIDPWLPRATVIGCYGRGEAGKSSWTAQICAAVSGQVSTLWISSEERQDHIKQRHLSCGGEPGTLAVIEAIPTKIDPTTKKPIATMFNIYEHMERALLAFQLDQSSRRDRPLGVVVLDAVVALVTWGKGENANDDAGVKRLIAHLFTLAERHGVTFLMLGHLRKNTNKDHIADSVTGAAAWTNSVRLAYMFIKNLESDNYEGFIRTVKSNTGKPFGAIYKTVSVFELQKRPDGHHDVLCGVVMIGHTVWGEVALREMMASDEENERWLNKREKKAKIVQAIVESTLRAVRNGSTTREAIDLTFGITPPSRRHWQEADALLSQHGVRMSDAAHGRRIYSLT